MTSTLYGLSCKSPGLQGNKKKRLDGEEHMAAVEEFCLAVQDKWPGVRMSPAACSGHIAWLQSLCPDRRAAVASWHRWPDEPLHQEKGKGGVLEAIAGLVFSCINASMH